MLFIYSICPSISSNDFLILSIVELLEFEDWNCSHNFFIFMEFLCISDIYFLVRSSNSSAFPPFSSYSSSYVNSRFVFLDFCTELIKHFLFKLSFFFWDAGVLGVNTLLPRQNKSFIELKFRDIRLEFRDSLSLFSSSWSNSHSTSTDSNIDSLSMCSVRTISSQTSNRAVGHSAFLWLSLSKMSTFAWKIPNSSNFWDCWNS